MLWNNALKLFILTIFLFSTSYNAQSNDDDLPPEPDAEDLMKKQETKKKADNDEPGHGHGHAHE